MAASLTEEELAATKAAVDCGQDNVCAKPPGCARHWEERNRELVEQVANQARHIRQLQHALTVEENSHSETESELAATKALVESAQADRQRAVDDLFAEAKRSSELQAELASARRAVEDVTDAWARYQRNDLSRDEFEGFIAERFETSSPGYALASAVTDADRAEAPRDEAGESEPVAALRERIAAMPDAEVDTFWQRLQKFVAEPTEEPKPEPQPDAPLPLPWRLEFDGTLWSVMSADGQHVADDLREADARRIVERCGREEQQGAAK